MADEVPVREVMHFHRCACILVHTFDDGEVNRDECHAVVDNPDQPMCRDCETAGHDKAEPYRGRRGGRMCTSSMMPLAEAIEYRRQEGANNG